MATTDIIITIVLFMVACAMFLLSYLQFKEKMILLNNAWIYASKKERETMNKTPHYRQSGVVFALIGLNFLIDAIGCILHNADLMLYAVIIISVIAVIYAIVSSIRIEKKNKLKFWNDDAKMNESYEVINERNEKIFYK